jgi:hypothetical protein
MLSPKDAAEKYPNFIKVSEDGILELYLDNHMLSNFRKCQGLFQEQFINNIYPTGRSWSLEFGQYVHKCMEYFYQAQRDSWSGEFNHPGALSENPIHIKQDFSNWLIICRDLWTNYQLDDFADWKQHKSLGGWQGALGLLTEYYGCYANKERLRFVGWELSFGRSKEVPIIDEEVSVQLFKHYSMPGLFRGYYCGRLDMVVDDGSIIGPLDHKTTAYFDGNESADFKPHDGMQGYVYSLQQMLGTKLQAEGRMCNNIIINHISLRTCKDPIDRFKRSYKPYTPEEMLEWKQRQIETFIGIYNLVVLERAATWNTELCKMFYFSMVCPYKQLHEVPPVMRKQLVKINYEERKPWNPYAV